MHVDGETVRGNERQALRIARGLAARGHHVAVSCKADSPVRALFAAEGIAMTGVRPRGNADAWNALRFAAWLRRERADAVLLTSWKRVGIAAAAARAAGVPRIVLRLGETHPVPPGAHGAFPRLALRRIYTDVIANSRMVAEHFAAEVGRARVHVVVNGITPHRAAPAPIRDELGIPADAPLAVAVGGAEPKKGFDLLVDAAAELDPRLHLVLAGGGREDRVERLRSRIAARGLAGRAHLLPWRGDVPALLAAANLFVLPSRSEGMSVAMLEAMAAGTPVVAAEVGGVWDALAAREERGPAGWIVPAADAAALRGGLRDALADLSSGGAEARARTAEAAWRMEHWFTIERMIDGYEAVLAGEAG